MSAQRDITEAAQVRACVACRAPIIAARVEGLISRTDPANITGDGELAALLLNRCTFDAAIHGYPRRLYLTYRSAPRIISRKRGLVLATHKCGQPLPAELTAPLGVDLDALVADDLDPQYPESPPF